MSQDPLARLAADGRERLGAYLALLAADRTAPSTVTDPPDAWRVHVADSLAGLEVEELAAARRIADVGAGAGFPGVALAAALPPARIDLIEATGRKCDFMRRALSAARIENASVVCERAEALAFGRGRDAYEAVTARAVGRLATLAELASPLLRPEGVLIAWKGRRDPDEEAEAERARERLAMAPEQILAVGPFAGSRHRHLHVLRKTGTTPTDLPRRPGMAKKRPFGSLT